jgi:predicted acylesterase/phospholipase RssA
VARQLGAVLGVALLVAVIGTPDAGNPQAVLDAFDRGWVFAGSCLAAAALTVWTMGRVVRPSEASAAEAEAEAERRAGLPTYPDLPSLPVPESVPRSVLPARMTPAEILAEVSIFRDLDAALREEIAAHAEIVQVPAGAHLFRAGDTADALYVLLGGRCDVVAADDEHLLTVGRGAVLGELGLITGAPRAASVRARRDSELLKLRHNEFELLLRNESSFALGLTRELGRQLQASRPLALPNRSGDTLVALVPVGADVHIDGIADELFEAMSSWEQVARIDKPAAEDPAVTLVRLEHLERNHDRVLFVSTPLDGRTPDAWSEFCLRQADRIVAVVGDAAPADWVRHHPALLECDLVLTGAADAPAWVAEVRPEGTHRLRPETGDADLRRLARRLTGRSVGVVLSGGGARALAHLGALEELMAAGIVIDRVGGVSMGAFIGALFAQELDVDEIDARCYDEFIRRSPLSDYRFPRVSLSSGERARRMLLRNLPGRIEDLPRDFFCVSADLITGKQVTHRFGHLAYAISASMCLPGLVPPVPYGSRYLIDGGALNNLPVDEMAARNEGPVIAIDVTSRSDTSTLEQPANRRGLREDWPWNDDAPMPTIGETITRLVLLGSVDTAEAARRHADLVILPEDDGVGLFEFHMLDTMRESGRRAARQALANAPASLFVS